MDLHGRRFLVVGATGALGGRLAHALDDAGARVAVAGRDRERLTRIADDLGAPSVRLDLEEDGAAARAVDEAAQALGALDGLVIATGAVAFGGAHELDDAMSRRLLTVNALGPIALVRALLAQLEGDGAVVALSAIVADHPTAGMAAYSASKAALSAYLTAVRRERRRDGLVVLDVRPPHLDTPFADRALAGSPPQLPEGADPDQLVAQVVMALRDDKRELIYDLRSRTLVTR